MILAFGSILILIAFLALAVWWLGLRVAAAEDRALMARDIAKEARWQARAGVGDRRLHTNQIAALESEARLSRRAIEALIEDVEEQEQEVLFDADA